MRAHLLINRLAEIRLVEVWLSQWRQNGLLMGIVGVTLFSSPVSLAPFASLKVKDLPKPLIVAFSFGVMLNYSRTVLSH